MRRHALRGAFGLLGLILLFAAAVVATAQPGDPALYPAMGHDQHTIYVVSHGYHSGLVVPGPELAAIAGAQSFAALTAVATRFAAYPWLEIGWGDEHFYREVPDAAALTIGLALRALFLPGNASVLHVVGLSEAPRKMFPASDLARLDLGAASFRRVMGRLDASFAHGNSGLPVFDLGPGIYGPSLFYRAVGTFSIFNVCNHWVADLLDAGGVPTAPVLATLPVGLLLDLEWRSGAVILPRD